MKFTHLSLLFFLPILLLGQKNRIALSYHTAYIMEQAEYTKMGLHLNLERRIKNNWSASFEWAMEDYCRCDWERYRFVFRTFAASAVHESNSSEHQSLPAFSRFFLWSVIFQYDWQLKERNSHVILGTGLLWRSGIESFILARTSFENIYDIRYSSDWAIPIRIAYRYDPPHRWWGLTAYMLYQGYFHYERDYLGNNPMNVLQAGLNFDIRFGKREKLKRERE